MLKPFSRLQVASRITSTLWISLLLLSLLQQSFLFCFAVSNFKNLDVSTIYAESGFVKVLRNEHDNQIKEGEKRNHDVCFHIHLPQCQIDELFAFVKDSTDSSHENFQKFLTISEVEELTKCEDHQLHIDTIIKEWFMEDNNSNFHYEIKNKKIDVCASYDYLTSKLFPSNTFSTYTKGKDSSQSFQILCNEKNLLLPTSLNSHITLITGLHPFNFKAKRHNYKKKDLIELSAQTVRATLEEGKLSEKDFTKSIPLADFDDDETQCILNSSESQCVNPTLIQTAYNYPAATQSYSNQQGVVEFLNQLYDPDDLKLAVEQMATSDYAKNYVIQGDDATLITADIGYEASLDVEYIVMVGGGVPTLVELVQPPSAYVLEWATDLLDGNTTYLLPENGGPYIWSMSYGAQEWSLLYYGAGGSSDYISQSEIALAKMASLGITNIISSGDDGSPFGNPACPIDSNYFVIVDNDKLAKCPFDKGCYAATYVVSYTDPIDNVEYTCSLPTGWNNLGLNDLPLLGCGLIYEVCDELFSNLESVTSLNDCNYKLLKFDNTDDDDNLPHTYILYSENTTTCQAPLNYNDGKSPCSLQNFDYNEEDYGTMFWASYPATSAFATAVASTAIKPNSNPGDQIVTYEFNPGGGFSSVIPRPWYQMEYVATYLNDPTLLPPSGTFNSSNRAFPDLALYGQDVAIVVDGQDTLIGGTSCSAPILSGILGTLINIRLNNGQGPLGLLNPYLYQMKANNSDSFTKIAPYTVDFPPTNPQYGSNNCSYDNGVIDYFCTYGYLPSSQIPWDAVTGLGNPNYTEWLIALAYQSPSDSSSKPLSRPIIVIIIVIVIVVLVITGITVWRSCLIDKKRRQQDDRIRLISQGERELTFSSQNSNIQDSKIHRKPSSSSISSGYQPPSPSTTSKHVIVTV